MVVSDHGHLLGEHGYTGKLGYALYPELTDTVLMVRHPEGKGAGKTSDFFASTHDVAPTILGFLGVEQPDPMDGEDLTPLLGGAGPEQPRDPITQGMYRYVCCRDEDWVMFCRGDGTDAVDDPDERHDLAEAEPKTVKRMYEEYAQKDAAGRLPNFRERRWGEVRRITLPRRWVNRGQTVSGRTAIASMETSSPRGSSILAGAERAGGGSGIRLA